MALVAQGQVADRPFGRTVYAVAARAFTGELRLTADGQSYRVGWRDGQIVAADSPAPADTVGRVALAAGLLTTAQLSDALRTIARGGGGTQLEIVARAGGLDETRVVELRRLVVAQRAMRVFALDSAAFALHDQLELDRDGDAPPLDPLWAIYHGVAAHYSEARLKKELHGVGGLRLIEAQIGLLPRFGFDPAIKPMLQRMRQAPMTPAGGKDDLAVLYALWCCGCAEATATVAPAPPPPPRSALPPKPAPTPPPAPAKPSDDPTRNLILAKLALVKKGADHFELLGVTRTVRTDELHKAYLALARVLHPDRLRAHAIDDPEVGKVFAVVNQAFAVLNDPSMRAKYIHKLERGNVDEDAEAEALAARLFGAEEAFQRGLAALRRNQPAAAIGDFKRAVELNPEEGEHLAMLAWAMFCAAPDKEAAARDVRPLFTRAIAMAPRCVPAYFFRGQVAKATNNLESALECFRKVLELEPEHKDAETELRLLAARADKDKKGGGLLDKLRGR
ncbi:MAG TPA: tetratricopeptide repeat protein [Kofleriaceae bacterium]|nr:tetratricopeptide repeat protein [Kofleriaceae bacterium]